MATQTGDTITMDANEIIESQMTPYQMRNRRELLAIEKKLNELPNNPIKIFEEFNLPIIFLNDVKTTGSGYNRTFERNGKSFKRPELLAKSYFEELGYTVAWNEGESLRIITTSIMIEVAHRLRNDIISEINKKRSKNKNETVPQDLLPILKEEDDKFKSIAEKGGPEFYKSIREVLKSLLINDEETFLKRFEFESCPIGLFYFQSPNAMREKVINCLNDLSATKPINDITRWYPSLENINEEEWAKKKNLNEWTLKFSTEILTNFQWNHIIECIITNQGYYSCSFDLTLIEASGKIKFVEVKFRDKLTSSQLTDIQIGLLKKYSMELAVISE